jgi:plastocyanin
MRQSTKLGAAVLASAALLAAGCGSDNNKSSDNGAATTPVAAGKANPGGAAAISMKNIQFAPKDQTVKVGDKVTWTNDDAVAHNVTANSGASFKSSDFGQGKTYEYTPKAAGTIKYTCTIHPGMDGTLTVTK